MDWKTISAYLYFSSLSINPYFTFASKKGTLKVNIIPKVNAKQLIKKQTEVFWPYPGLIPSHLYHKNKIWNQKAVGI